MTNEQLAILLDQLAARLDHELVTVRQCLPEDFERFTVRRFGLQEGWYDAPGDFVVLEGVVGLGKELRRQAESLRKAGCDECRAR